MRAEIGVLKLLVQSERVWKQQIPNSQNALRMDLPAEIGVPMLLVQFEPVLKKTNQNYQYTLRMEL